MRLLFVDDDESILEFVQALLADVKQWECEFVSSGKAALESLEKTPADAIIADMEMPEMNGVELLSQVKEKHPGTLRLVLSAHENYEEVLRTVGTAHHFMVKPVNLDILKKVLDEAVSLKSLLSSGALQELTASIGALPSIPSLYQKVVKEAQSPDASMANIAKIISQDPAMTATILRLINSSHFGMSRKIQKIADAINLIGLKTVQSLILGSHAFKQLDPGKCPEVNGDALWQHGFLTSSFAQAIARAEKASSPVQNESQMAGMLHAVGTLIFASRRPAELSKAIKMAKEKGIPRADAEREVFGCTHGELGGYLLGLWGIPEGVVAALAYHHHPIASKDGKFSALTAVHAAEVFADKAMAESIGSSAAKLDEEYLKSMGMEARLSVWEEECKKVTEEAEQKKE